MHRSTKKKNYQEIRQIKSKQLLLILTQEVYKCCWLLVKKKGEVMGTIDRLCITDVATKAVD